MISSHHVLTLLMGDKLYLAPVPDDIQVGRPVTRWVMLIHMVL